MQQRSPVRIKTGTLRLNGVSLSPLGHEDTPSEFPFCLACHFHSWKYSRGCNFCPFRWRFKWWCTTGRNTVLRPAVQTVNYCMHNLVSPFISCWKHEAKVQKKQICRDDVNLAQMFNLGNCNIQYNTQNNLHPPPTPKVLQLCADYFCELGLFFFVLTPVFSISGYSLRLTHWDWLHRSKVSFFAPVVAFFPSYRNPRAAVSLFSVSFHL